MVKVRFMHVMALIVSTTPENSLTDPIPIPIQKKEYADQVIVG